MRTSGPNGLDSQVHYAATSPAATSSAALLGQPSPAFSQSPSQDGLGASSASDVRSLAGGSSALYPASMTSGDTKRGLGEDRSTSGFSLLAADPRDRADGPQGVLVPYPRTATDGGIRLAGGPLDETLRDDDDDGTLPPPYQRY